MQQALDDVLAEPGVLQSFLCGLVFLKKLKIMNFGLP